jgi:hypothetical protein
MALQKNYHFTLQVEDPQSEWSKDPRRYQQLADRYRALTGENSRIMLDLNILQFRNENTPTQFPTLIQTGIESYLLVRSASLGADRYTIYSESSVRPQDLRMMSYTASARATIKREPGGWTIQTPYSVVLDLPKEYTALRTSTGEHIVSDRGMFVLPKGTHVLNAEKGSAVPFSVPPLGGTLLSLTGDLASLNNFSRSVTFSYSSTSRCIASFSHRPFAILVDGKEITFETLEGYRRFSVLLPPGEHSVDAVLETTVSYGVDITSFWSSWLIVGFGIVSSTTLLSLYTAVRFSRSSGSST